MSIRSVDFQILIPKTPEIQKIKHAENENQRINQQISVKEDSTMKNKELKKVIKASKTYKASVDKDGKNSNSRSDGEEDEKYNKKKNKNKLITGSKIDIKI